MSRADDLFNALRINGLTALDRLIDDREPESLFLDFKGTHDTGTSLKLNSDDNKVISKGISGFGNSSGGVLVWGVDCRRDANGTEIATKQALINAVGFQGKIESSISRATLPPHSGVQTLLIPDGNGGDGGYLAALVPQAFCGPLRSVVTNHYHFRAGSSFEIIPHDVLAGMFGRAPIPKVDVNFINLNATLDISGQWLHLNLSLVGVNLGAVTAEKPYLAIWLNDFPPEHFQWECLNPVDYVVRAGRLPGRSMVAKNGIGIAPSATEDLCNLLFQIPVNHLHDVDIQLTVGATGSVPSRFSIKGSAADMDGMIATLRSGVGARSMDVLRVEG